MRMRFISAAAVLALGSMSAGAAFAQAQGTMEISGSLGAMTCSAFTALSPTAQADAIKEVGAMNPSGALTSNSGGTAATAKTSTSSTAAAGTPLTAGQLVAACQAAKPTSTVHDAFASFSSSNTPTKTK